MSAIELDHDGVRGIITDQLQVAARCLMCGWQTNVDVHPALMLDARAATDPPAALVPPLRVWLTLAVDGHGCPERL